MALDMKHSKRVTPNNGSSVKHSIIHRNVSICLLLQKQSRYLEQIAMFTPTLIPLWCILNLIENMSNENWTN